jgi:hypothetical protein
LSYTRGEPERHGRIPASRTRVVGRLVGVIYRSDRRTPGRARTYLHVMRDPPRLVCDTSGTQLYVVGGSYRVTQRGIEG